jgi:hypothetical protein
MNTLPTPLFIILLLIVIPRVEITMNSTHVKLKGTLVGGADEAGRNSEID